MADITLAEFNGGCWLISGDAYIDDLLANTLDAEISIEVVSCESGAAVRALWHERGEPVGMSDMPWMIHPNILARVRNAGGDLAVMFAPWSAMLDQTALEVIALAVGRAQARADLPVVLAEYLDPDGSPTMADLSRLRARLIEERLAAAGIDPGRFRRATRDSAAPGDAAGHSRRIDIIVATD